MTIMNIIKGKNNIYDFLLDAYDNSDYKRGYYLIELMIKCNVNLDEFVKFLAKNRSVELHKHSCYHQFFRNVFAKFIRQCRMAK
jgi:hypothetical protein